MHSHVLVQILQIENAYIDQNAGNIAFIHVYEPLHENVVLIASASNESSSEYMHMRELAITFATAIHEV